MQEFDLAIIGGGMAGLTLLAALQPAVNRGLRVTLIDPANEPDNKGLLSPSFDDRATALAEQTLQVFQAMNLTGIERAVSDITEIEVSDRGHLGFHQMQAEDHGVHRFGAVIANRSLGSLLWQQVKALPVDWRFSQEVSRITPTQQGHQLRLSSDENLLAKQVILCDGGRSKLIDQLGMAVQTTPFNARARIATVRTTEPHQGRAFERFTRTGPIALLPFGDYSALVWTIPDSEQSLLDFTPNEACEWLNQYLADRLGGITQVSEWHEYPLVQKTLTTNCIHGLLAVGNSAATLHPVAGQGFNLAIRGIVRTAALINRTFNSSGLLPELNQFQEINQLIQTDQNTTVNLSRKLISLFGSDSPLIQLSRNIGLSSLDRHPTLSKAFALGGMGLLQSLPVDDILPSDTRYS